MVRRGADSALTASERNKIPNLLNITSALIAGTGNVRATCVLGGRLPSVIRAKARANVNSRAVRFHHCKVF